MKPEEVKKLLGVAAGAAAALALILAHRRRTVVVGEYSVGVYTEDGVMIVDRRPGLLRRFQAP